MNKLIRIFGRISFLSLSLFLLLIFSSVHNASAQSVTFAQFFEQTGGQDFVFSNNGINLTGGVNSNFETVQGGSQIFFLYQNISNLDSSLQGPQSATLTMTSSTSTAATLAGSLLTQPLNEVTTIQITRNTPAPVGNGSRTNLLTAVFSQSISNPAITGNNNGNSATLSATTPNQTVTFTSDFISFFATTQRNLGLSFSSVNPSLTQGASNFLSDFAAAGSGTFASNPAPVVVMPSAASAIVSGRVYNPQGRGISRIVVAVTDLNGNRRTFRTNSFGNFRVSDLEVGETYIFNVLSKEFNFAPQFLTVNEDIQDLNFFPNP